LRNITKLTRGREEAALLVFQLKRLLKLKWLLPCLLLVLTAAGALMLKEGHPPAYYLSIYEGRSEEVITQLEVALADQVALDYIHSSDGTPVKAIFVIEEKGLRLVEEKYSWYGSGLESGAGYEFSYQEKEVTVSGYDRVFEELPVRVARTVAQNIHINEEIIALNQLAPGGSLLIIRVETE